MPREPTPHIVHFAADGGINAAYLVDQLSGNGQSIGDLAFIIAIAPEANGGATLDLENNTLAGVEQVVPSPDNHGQRKLDGLLAFVPG
jgi:hypothetical protein